MRKYVCDRCGVVIRNDSEVHKCGMSIKDNYLHDEYFQNLQFCTNCNDELVSTFENFLNSDKKLTDDEKRILEDMPALRKLAIMAGFEL